MAIDWSILRSPESVDVAGNFARGYELGDKIISNVHQHRALGDLAANPDDQNALAALYRVNPELGVRMETMNEHRHEAARKTDARNALGTIVGELGSHQFEDFAPNALTGRMPEPAIDAEAARDTPGTAISAPSVSGAMDTSRDAPPPPADNSEIVVTLNRPPEAIHPDLAGAWRDYASSDPEGAMKTLIERHDLNKSQAADLAAQMDIIGRLAGSATDEASYQRALEYGKTLGYDIAHLPQHFSPEAVSQIQTQAMRAKDAIKTKWDIQDDQIDNVRAEKAMQLQHHDRVRGQDVSAETSRRGQDVTDARQREAELRSSEDRRRGQDIGSTDRRRGQDMRRKSGAVRPTIIVNPKTGQRMKLENGKWIPA